MQFLFLEEYHTSGRYIITHAAEKSFQTPQNAWTNLRVIMLFVKFFLSLILN